MKPIAAVAQGGGRVADGMHGALLEGRAWPLGVHCDDTGVNVAVFSAHAQAVDLCLFDATGLHELARLRLPGHTGDVWHGHLADAGAGLVYGLRAHGPWRQIGRAHV